jgi:hypothetical protein
MAEKQARLPKFVVNMLPNMAWDAVKWIGGLAVIKQLWQLAKNEYYRSPTDWWMFSVWLALGVLLVAIGYRFQTRPDSAESDEDKGKTKWEWKQKFHWADGERSRLEAELSTSRTDKEKLAEEVQRLDIKLDHWQKPWHQYASEEVWKQSITEQNRLIELGRSVDGKLNATQLDILEAISALRGLARNAGPSPVYVPDPNFKDKAELGAKLFEWKLSLNSWSSKTDAQYRLTLASKVDAIRLKVSASSTDKTIQMQADLRELAELSKKQIEVSDDLGNIIDALESLFFNVRNEG